MMALWIKVAVLGYLIFLSVAMYQVIGRLNPRWLPTLLLTMSGLPWWLIFVMPGAWAMEGIPCAILFFAVLVSLIAVPILIVVHFTVWFPKRKTLGRGAFNGIALGFSILTIGTCLALHLSDRW